jgi:assimilatory nitrate reductase catalytic subunit
MTLPAKVVATIRPDTIFIPYHWAGRRAANQLTNRALDPLSKIPEFKVSAVRITRVGPPGTAVVDEREMDLVERDTRPDQPRRPASEPGEGGG